MDYRITAGIPGDFVAVVAISPINLPLDIGQGSNLTPLQKYTQRKCFKGEKGRLWRLQADNKAKRPMIKKIFDRLRLEIAKTRY